MGQKILGWDVGGTKSSLIIADIEGQLLHKTRCQTKVSAGPEAMISECVALARPLLARFPDISEMGVSIGGPMNPLTGRVLNPPHLPGWNNIALASRLEKDLNLKVRLEHDAAACLEAEWLWGAANGLTHAIYLTLGTGLGAGIMINGQILRGPQGESPEVGHLRLSESGPEAFGKEGCVESFCSGSGMVKYAHFKYPGEFSPDITARDLKALADDDHPHAPHILRHSARMTGRLCAMLTDIFSPEIIILGSLALYLGREWVAGIREEFAMEALKWNARNTRIVPSSLADQLQDLSSIAPVVYHKQIMAPAPQSVRDE